MAKNNNKMVYIPSEKNKDLEPLAGKKFVIGYDDEIHGEDSVEYNFKLPVGAIKRLIRSYYEEIYSICSMWIQCGQTGSYEIRMEPYCNRMISEIVKQLNKHGFNGQKIVDEVFNRSFKEDFDKLERFSKNHGDNIMEAFKPCSDPKCCKPEKEKSVTEDVTVTTEDDHE
jgi:hypothetical protein